MNVFIPIIVGLSLLGSFSPLFTFTALFQQKEWRLDRLREHLRREGWLKTLAGTIRLALLGGLAVAGALLIEGIRTGLLLQGPVTATELVGGFLLLWVGLFALLAMVQITVRKQRYPVWTGKACLIICLAIIIDLLAALAVPQINLILPLLQSLSVLIAWLLLLPVDSLLKKRTYHRAAAIRASLKEATVIGIAGSVGKTTVKELIAHLVQDLHPLVTPAHVNTEMGVAQWMVAKNSSIAANPSPILVVEMGAYRKGEIRLMCSFVRPTIGVMTALGSDHLALFGSEQNIIDANGELIEALPADGHAFFYGNNEACANLAKRSPCPVTIADDTGLKHPLPGKHNNYNVSLAVAVARSLGIADTRIVELLKTFKPQAHSFNVRSEHGVTVLDDTYNISPLSMAAALDWAASRPEHPRILLTSGLQETGTEETRFLRELGQKASSMIDRVIFTDPHGSDSFAETFGKPIEILGTQTQRVPEKSLLLAVGRMPLSVVSRLLP